MKKIKIAQVITRMDWGGSPDIVRILGSYLDKEKYDLSLICGPSKNSTEKTQIFLKQLGNKFIQIKYLRRNVNPLFDLIGLGQLYFVLRKNKFDIVHTHTAKAGALGRLAAFLCGVKIIIHTTHGNNFYGYFNKFVSQLIVLAERLLASFTNKIVALTKIEKKELLRFKICEQDKIETINTAIEIIPYHQKSKLITIKSNLGTLKKDFVFGMVARIEPIKGVDYFIEAALLLAKKFSEVHFLIVGEGSQKENLQNKVKAESLSERFTFTGWQDNPLHYMQAMDVLVLASLNEAVGLVLIEAQSIGVPVIATKVGGIPEIVDDGKSGLLVEPKDAHGLEKAMEIMLKDEQLRLKMKEYAVENIANKYSRDDFIRNIEQIYQQFIRNTA